MNVKAYAANAATRIGTTLAGTDTIKLLTNACPMLTPSSDVANSAT